jgi:hypothetical protein
VVPRSFRTSKHILEYGVEDQLVLELKPTDIEMDETKDILDSHIPILMNEDNMIQEQEFFP